ncbi:MAG: hypothetical protein HOP17_12225 [Acidobacteria bacterium]|nr:hypothetical protein [Acidobacteriota bacterium]
MTDAEKIVRLSTVMAEESNLNEALSLALLIEDVEDRNLYLVDISRTLLKQGDWQRAHGVTEFMEGGYERADALREIAEHAGLMGNIERSLSIFAEAETVSLNETSEGFWQRAELLNKIAKSLSRVNAKTKSNEMRKRAIEIALQGRASTNPQESNDSDSVLAEIAVDIAYDGEISKALSSAELIHSVPRRERALLQIASISSDVRKVA